MTAPSIHLGVRAVTEGVIRHRFEMESRYYHCDVSGVRRSPVLSENERREGLHEALVTWPEAIATNRAVLARDRHALPWVERELLVLEFLARERGLA